MIKRIQTITLKTVLTSVIWLSAHSVYAANNPEELNRGSIVPPSTRTTPPPQSFLLTLPQGTTSMGHLKPSTVIPVGFSGSAIPPPNGWNENSSLQPSQGTTSMVSLQASTPNTPHWGTTSQPNLGAFPAPWEQPSTTTTFQHFPASINDLNTQAEQIRCLSASITTLISKNQILKDEKEALRQQYIELSSMIADEQKKAAGSLAAEKEKSVKLQKELDTLNQRFTITGGEVETLKKNHINTVNQYNGLKATAIEQAKKIGDLEANITHHTAKFETEKKQLNDRISGLTTQLGTSTAYQQTLQMEIARLKNLNEEARKNGTDEQQKKIETLTREVEINNQSIKTTMALYQESLAKNKQLAAYIATFDETRKNLEAVIAENKKVIELWKEDSARKTNDIDQKTKDNQHLKKENEILAHANGTLKNQQTELKRTISILQQDNAALRDTIIQGKQLYEQLDSLQAEIKSKDEQIKCLQERLHNRGKGFNTVKEVAKLERDLEQQEKDFHKKIEELKATHQAESTSLQEQKKAQEAQITQLKTEIALYQSNDENQKEIIIQLEQNIKILEERVEGLQDALYQAGKKKK